MDFASSATNKHEVTPFDYEVEELLLLTDSGSLDITYLLSEMNIIESLYSKCITGSLILVDALNLISNLPIMEGDMIQGFFTRNKKDKWVEEFDPDFELKFMFEIIKITSQTKVKQDVQIWSIHFVSSTWSDHLTGRVSKSYRQWLYSDMVNDIYDRHLTKGGLKGELPVKALKITPTEKLWNIIIPNIKPHDAITFLSRRSWQGDFVNYLFWEDKEEFHYQPMEDLFAAGPVADYWTTETDQYTKEKLAREPDLEVLEPRYLNLIELKFLDYHDITISGMSGMFANRLISHDLFFKRVVDHFPRGEEAPNYTLDDVYSYFDDYSKLSHCDSNGKEMVRAYTNAKFSDNNGLLTVYPEHKWQWDDQEEFMPRKWVRQRKGQISQLKFIKLEVTTPGNFTRKVGDKININLYSPEYKPKTTDERPELDTKFQGNYLITSLKRKFTKDKCYNIMEIIKDDYYDLKEKIFEPKEDTGALKIYPGQTGRTIGL